MEFPSRSLRICYFFPGNLLERFLRKKKKVPESGKAEGSEFEQQSRGLREVPESVVPSEQQSHASRASGVRSSLCMLRYL